MTCQRANLSKHKRRIGSVPECTTAIAKIVIRRSYITKQGIVKCGDDNTSFMSCVEVKRDITSNAFLYFYHVVNMQHKQGIGMKFGTNTVPADPSIFHELNLKRRRLPQISNVEKVELKKTVPFDIPVLKITSINSNYI